eukprot:1797481-Pleurochrysis_carterae.AAC.1
MSAGAVVWTLYEVVGPVSVYAGAGGGNAVGVESVNTGAGGGDGSGVAVGRLAHLDNSGCENAVGVE